MSNWLKEFREFAVKGNVVDLAVGVVIGAAFGKIVSSLVADIIMPIVGLLVGGINFSHNKLILRVASGDVPAVTLNWGPFLQTVVDFLLVAWAIFVVVKLINRMKRTEQVAPTVPPPITPEVQLLTEIRNLLREKK